ncbi:unnamed protein product [Penicillium roqueforti FM164]|uniref:Genomic scaffold, ProqFM164S02 n=1 Tax=Penicillium roqueforti (strain FM164) TaxID=1365484 RepID=W6Q5M7_PENRF|nr:unnamed protein product [Penicillium roqueforti FM164]
MAFTSLGKPGEDTEAVRSTGSVQNYVFSKYDHSVRWIPEGRRGRRYPPHPHYLAPFSRWLPSDSVVGGPGIRVGPVWVTPGTNPREIVGPRGL